MGAQKHSNQRYQPQYGEFGAGYGANYGGGGPPQYQQNQQYNYPQQQMGWLNQQMGNPNPTPMAQQMGTSAPVANTGNSFVQGSLNASKGDANYDSFSDFDNDGMVTTKDFGEYMRANPQGQASMVESQGSRDNKMSQMESLRGLMSKLQSQMGGSNQGIGGYGGQQGVQPKWFQNNSQFQNMMGNTQGYGGGYNQSYQPQYIPGRYNQGLGGYGQRYYKDGGLIRGYQDGGAMGGEIIDESMSMMPGPMGGEMVDESMTMMSDPMAPSPGMGGGNDAMLTIVLEAKSALEGTHPDPMSAIQTFVEVFGEDEFMSLKEHVLQSIETGEDKFSSDGMSDSIPGNIDGMEDVALSEGEYVVPADVVSGMGNGDTDSGAQRMREMIEMVRSARTGGVEQPPAIDPSMYSPV